ncbi:alpha-L-rhamnosidase C-terminal domain-containing protein [Leifsonia sp. NPDC080035]|uniref:Alpha-L-rhamnosidase C-terminal domain-containing protein n=1 Tax=Leifsonia sp. NPDC080035 TaxID=3143936 RepID=A0AAU7GG78_9MICO
MTWHYPPHQYELGLLHTLVRKGRAANRHVDYAPNYADTMRSAEFSVDGADPFTIEAPAGEPPAVWTDGAADVRVREPGGEWTEPREVPGTASTPPHREPEPIVTLEPTPRDGLWELASPVLGRPVFRSASTPVVSSGESREEAFALTEEQETRHDVRRLPDGRWTTVHALGFRFLRIDADDVTELVVEAYEHPVSRTGSFACSDATLTRIWQVSASTLHTCMHGLMLDGIKRDRMPWIGDQALNTLANAYAFGDAGIVQDSLVALGRPRSGYVNGIADYSLWWLIATGFLARSFDARDHLAAEADNIHAFATDLAAHAGEDGLLRPAGTDDDFQLVFIDWGVDVDPTRDPTALQLLWHWALTSTADVLASAGHPGAERWRELAATVRATLQRVGRTADGGWRAYADGSAEASLYPAFLAVLAGLSGPGDASVAALLAGAERAGTPFMTGFFLRALIELGDTEGAVRRIRALWGGMLDAGATSFWEDFAEASDSDGTDSDRADSDIAMYGRPFGKSLCHAWSSGPAALLPDAILGLRPLADGWSRFAVDPHLGGLEWAEARVPTPGGDIAVTVRGGDVTVDVPPGSTLVGPEGEHPGPAVVRWPTALG